MAEVGIVTPVPEKDNIGSIVISDVKNETNSSSSDESSASRQSTRASSACQSTFDTPPSGATIERNRAAQTSETETSNRYTYEKSLRRSVTKLLRWTPSKSGRLPRGKHAIQLYLPKESASVGESSASVLPLNSVSLLLEELGVEHDTWLVGASVLTGVASPSSKIPLLIDYDPRNTGTVGILSDVEYYFGNSNSIETVSKASTKDDSKNTIESDSMTCGSATKKRRGATNYFVEFDIDTDAVLRDGSEQNTSSNPVKLFETGAILLYLATKYNKFLDTQNAAKKAETWNWLFCNGGLNNGISGILLGGSLNSGISGSSNAPYTDHLDGLGGCPSQLITKLNSFPAHCVAGRITRGSALRIQHAISRFTMEAKRQLELLNKRLGKLKYVVGNNEEDYSIADMSILPWVLALRDRGSRKFHSFDNYTNVVRWIKDMDGRDSVQRLIGKS